MSRTAILVALSFFVTGCWSSGNKDDLFQTDLNFGYRFSEQLLSHYQKASDTLGFKSALFLIKNMRSRYTNDLTAHARTFDTTSVEIGYLINNIDMALRFARSPLNSGHLTFENYTEYILPYRFGSEPLIDWRSDRVRFFEKLRARTDTGKLDWKASTMMINSQLSNQFTYGDNIGDVHSMNLHDLQSAGKGDCWAMVNLAAYSIRAAGIPVAIDFVPRWANINGGTHAWNVLIDESSEEHPFMGSESRSFGYDPLGIYYQKRIPGKVFRSTYSATLSQEQRAAIHREHIPDDLIVDRVKDVTDHYIPTGTIDIPTSGFGDHEIAFLAVFSNGGWKPVFWSLRRNQRFVFEKMAADVLYQPMMYEEGDVLPIGQPIYISGSDRGMKRFTPKMGARIDIPIEFVKSKELDEQQIYNKGLTGANFFAAMDSLKMGFNRSRPLDSGEYILFYWDGEWKLHSAQRKYPLERLVFKKVPSGCVYRLLQRGSDRKERMFSFSGGKQIWW